ncbi:glycosyltransferase family 2 protein [Francisella sp. 19X1-34]|uniref:glycosyltransferase family 2 protein n=1 Tax=Francisella sp. 19X1-34 TaxID=3087177 RepID=UPI002E3675BA|nr:glycosyltransferase family 2 protein [Francisella sp. 19X1-34]MED7788021.1 glycosyltransferase family 2 protein [Francisella sp. 19X1-34]
MQDIITIIIPIYNVEKYLRRCINSVITQTYENLEIILVNDGSTDNSLVICQQYEKEDSRIKVINKKNGGLSSSRNAALDICTGKYISFIDGDDFIDSNFIEKLYTEIIASEADVTISSIDRTSSDKVKENNHRIRKEFMGYQVLEQFFLQEISSSVCDKLYKRELIVEHRFKENLFLEDIEFNSKVLLNAHKAVFTNEVNYYHYVRKGSILYNSRKRINDKQSEDVLYIFGSLEKYYIKKSIKMDIFYKYSFNVVGTYLVLGLFSFSRRQFKKMLCYYDAIFLRLPKDNSIKIKLKYLIFRYMPFLVWLRYSFKFWFDQVR